MIKVVDVTKTDILSGFHRGQEDVTLFSRITNDVCEGVINEAEVYLNSHASRGVELIAVPGVLQIVFWGYIDGVTKNKTTDLESGTTLWGFSRFYNKGFYEPTGMGIPVISPEGIAVAEWFPEYSILVTLFDACDTMFKNCEDTAEIYKIMLTEFAENIYAQGGLGLLSKEEIDARRKIAYDERKLKAILTLLTSIASVKVSTFKDQITKSDEIMDKSRRDLLINMKTKQHAIKQLDIFQNEVKGDGNKMLAEFEQILTMAHIVDYDISGNSIVFTTDTIVMPVNDRFFLAGSYKIDVNVTNAGVKFLNQTPENMRKSVWGEKCHHPHVNLEGGPCLGNATEGIIQCVNGGEWVALASILVAYLESVNLDDSAGRYFYNWDECDKDGTVIRKSNGCDPFKKALCYQCGSSHMSADMITCSDTARVLCTDCAVWLPRYERYVQKNLTIDGHYIVCNKCGEITAKGDTYRGKCNTCRKIAADIKAAKEAKNKEKGIISEHTCGICDKAVAESELMICEKCGIQGCGSCISTNGTPVYMCADCANAAIIPSGAKAAITYFDEPLDDEDNDEDSDYDEDDEDDEDNDEGDDD